MPKVRIPSSIKDATSKLTGIERLLQASEWERSAIVRAFVTKAQGKRTSIESDRSLTIDEFTELGIVGLKGKNTVRRYYDSWDLSGQPEPEPGKDIELPDRPFPTQQDMQNQREVLQAVRGFVQKNRESISMLHEYDEKFWSLLNDADLQTMEESVEDVIDILAELDLERLERIAKLIAEKLAEEER